MHLIYRTSDKSSTGQRIPGGNRAVCLKNFLQIFGRENLKIFADNCDSQTYGVLGEQQLEYEVTSLGNSGSLRRALDYAATLNGTVYFVEDDYIHREAAPLLITEGLALADYVTLYDDPEKYSPLYGSGETSQVRRTLASHWRYTRSTRMTFGTTAETLRQDWDIWRKWTETTKPLADQLFEELGEAKRLLTVCVPGAAAHCDLTYSAFAGTCLIEEWALDFLVMEAIERVLDLAPQSASMVMGLNLRYEQDKLKMLGLLHALEKEAASRKSREAASQSSEPLRL